MKIGIVVKEFPPDTIGGAETQTKRMASALHKRGHNITVFTKQYRTHDDEKLSYEIVRVPNVRTNPFISDLTFFLACSYLLLKRRHEFNCLQCMMIYPIGFLGYVVSHFTGVPYFAWIRGNDFYVAKNVRWKQWMIRRVLSDTLVLVQSSEIKTDVRAEFPDLEPSLHVLGNGISVPPEPRPEPDKYRVLYLGRLAPKKGVKYLLEAVAQLSIDCELIIVGDGNRRRELKRKANELGIDVQFEGFVHPDEVGEYYRRASVFVLPSTEGEGMPNAVLEAMAWGVPVITTNSGGLPSLVRDGTTGRIVSMRDSASIATALEELLSKPHKREQIGNNAREYVRERYGWDRIVEELEEVYTNVTS